MSVESRTSCDAADLSGFVDTNYGQSSTLVECAAEAKETKERNHTHVGCLCDPRSASWCTFLSDFSCSVFLSRFGVFLFFACDALRWP